MVASPDFAAAVATYRKAEATAANARRIAELDEQLFANDALARRDLEQARTDAASAEADREAALQQLRALGVDDGRDRGDRGAPAGRPGRRRSSGRRSTGPVVEKLITPGQLLQAGTTPCFTVADLSTRVGDGATSSRPTCPTWPSGDSAAITLTDGTAGLYRGTRGLRRARWWIRRRKATAVRVVAPNPGEVLKRDMFVRVTIQLATAAGTGLLVPVVGGAARRREPAVRLRRRRRTARSSGGRSQLGSAGRRPLRGRGPGWRRASSVVDEGGLFLQFAESQ